MKVYLQSIGNLQTGFYLIESHWSLEKNVNGNHGNQYGMEAGPLPHWSFVLEIITDQMKIYWFGAEEKPSRELQRLKPEMKNDYNA